MEISTKHGEKQVRNTAFGTRTKESIRWIFLSLLRPAPLRKGLSSFPASVSSSKLFRAVKIARKVRMVHDEYKA